MARKPISEKARKELAAKRATEQVAQDESIVTAPVRKRPGHEGRQSKARRVAAQVRIDARNAPVVAPSEGVPAGIAVPPVTLEDLGIATPSNVVANAIQDNAVAKEREQAIADTNQFAELRRQLGTFDTSDIEAERKYLTSISSTGRLSSGSADALNKQAQERRTTALAALQAIDTNRNAVRSGNIAERQDRALIAEVYNRIMRSNVDDSTKTQLDYWKGIATDPRLQNTEQGKYAQIQLLNIMKQLNRDSISGQEAAQGLADGGEVFPAEEFARASDQAPPELPGAINETPLPLDSGDYIIPVEAMRFYGRKFFQDLINRAEDVE